MSRLPLRVTEGNRGTEKPRSGLNAEARSLTGFGPHGSVEDCRDEAERRGCQRIEAAMGRLIKSACKRRDRLEQGERIYF